MSLRYPGGLITKSPTAPTSSAAPGIWTLEQALQYIKAGTWPLSALGDPYFGYNTLLLPGQGTNGANNKTFLDSGTANSGVPFTVSSSGTPTQGTFTPFSEAPGYWSNYFDGTSSYLTGGSGSGSLGSGNFTVEAFVYATSTPQAYNTIFSNYSTYGTTVALLFFGGDSKINFIANGTTLTSTSALQLNTWNHVAAVRNSGVITLYVNGVSQATLSYSGSSSGSGVAYVGTAGDAPTTTEYTGYISNLRVTTSAVYTSAFTPPTSPLTAISNTIFLTCQSNRFVDNSTNAYAITATGSPSVQTFQPFGAPTSAYSAATIGGSGYFDGSGDDLSVANNSAFDFGSGDFTLEFWYYPTAAGQSGYSALLSKFASSASYAPFSIVQKPSSYDIGLSASSTGSSWDLSNATSSNFGTMQANAWNHIAVSRQGSNCRCFLNGVLNQTSNFSTTALMTNSSPVYIGSGNAANTYATGYLSGVRILKGTAVYTAAFTPPTAPLTNIANTSLLLNFTNGGIIDNAVSNDLVTVNDASISTTQYKWGTSSIYLDGTGDYLFAPTSQNIAFGTGDFTWEAWIYVTTVGAGDKPIYESRSTNSNTDGFTVTAFSSTVIRVYTNTVVVTATVSNYLNTWTHVAFVRVAGVCKLYVNGNECASAAFTSNLTNTTAAVGAGRYGSANLDTYLTGYIADLRLTKGYARYLYNFTAPTAAFPLFYQAAPTPTTDPYFENTTLLLAGNQPSGVTDTNNNVFKDSSANNFTITRNPASGPNAPTQGTFTPFSKVNGRWGNYFDGTSGQYLNTVANTAFNFGTGDFTVEGWVYPTGTNASAPMPIVEVRTSSTNTSGFSFVRSQNALTLNVYSNGYLGASTNSLALNQWNHVALVRSGNTWTYWINGVSSGSFTNSTTQSDGGTTGPKIGGSTTAGEVWIGYLSNIRITKGAALYTTGFTPSTTPLTTTVSSGTVSLLTCQSNRFIDNSANAFAITVNGSPSVQAFSPFPTTASYSAGTNGGSGYFDGTGDYLTTPSNAALGFGTGDFTVEFWYYHLSRASTDTIAAPSTDNLNVYINTSGVLGYYNGSSAQNSSQTVPLNAWGHIALVRSSSTIKMYYNGVEVLSQSNTTNLGTASWYIGTNAGNSDPSNGYVTDVRLVKGTAVYTAAFTPPTAPLTAITNTSLLCNFTNGGIIDNTMSNDLETVGGAAISTTQSKFGGSSIYFDGNGDNLSGPSTADLNCGTGDFTFEAWIYISSRTLNYPLIIGNNNGGFTAGGIALTNSNADNVSFNDKFLLVVYDFGGGRMPLLSSVTNSTATWYHLAVVRYGTSLKMYRNGIEVASTTISSSLVFDWGKLGVRIGGGNWDGAQSYFNGYIDDLRLTKGIARYVQNFTPPTSAFLTL